MAVAYVSSGGRFSRFGGEEFLAGIAGLDEDAEGVFLRDGPRRVYVSAGKSPVTSGATVVSCGMSERDSVNCSSAAEGVAVLSVRRALPTVFGGSVCVQDIVLNSSKRPELIAFRGGVLLCAGVPPEKLEQLL